MDGSLSVISNPREILIYSDEGVGPHSLRACIESLEEASSFPVKAVDHRFLLESAWLEKTALLVFPGGADRPYQQKFQGAGNRRIVDYVQCGGSYLGICAGAYYASASIEFEKGSPLEIIEPRELRFFPGRAVGPAFGSSEEGAKAISIEWMRDLGLPDGYHYDGGCYFEAAEKYPTTQILARYRERKGHPAAVILSSVTQGRALLSGIHPEHYPLNRRHLWHYLLSLLIT